MSYKEIDSLMLMDNDVTMPSKPTYEELEKSVNDLNKTQMFYTKSNAALSDLNCNLIAALDRAATKISDLTCRDKEVIINELMKGGDDNDENIKV